MSEQNPFERDEQSADAAALAMGLLEGAERAEARAQLETDPAFAAEVAAWQRRLSGMDEDFVAVAPPKRLKRKIEARLFRRRRNGLVSLWQSAGLWRGVAVLGTAAAVVLALRPGLVPLPPELQPAPVAEARLITALYAPDDGLNVIATLDPTQAVLRVTRLEGAARPGRELELWFAPDPDTAPTSLGLITEQTVLALPLDPALAGTVGAAGYFAISDEPPGGSPTGAPTGDVLAVGQIEEIDI